MSSKNKKRFDQIIEHQPGEMGEILKNTAFTNLVTEELFERPLIEYIDCLMIITNVHDLKIAFTDKGLVAVKKDFDTAMSILANSVVNN